MKYLLIALLLTPPLISMELDNRINPNIIRASVALKDVALYHDTNGFIVEENGNKSPIYRYNLSSDFRQFSDQDIETLLQHNKNILIYIKKNSDNTYSLDLEGKLKAGGAWAGWAAYNITRSALYGCIATAVGMLVKGSAGKKIAGGSLQTGIGAGASRIVTTSASVLAGTPEPLSTPLGFSSSVIGAGIGAQVAETVGSNNVVDGVIATMAVAGGAPGVVATVEGISVAVGAFFAAQLWLP